MTATRYYPTTNLLLGDDQGRCETLYQWVVRWMTDLGMILEGGRSSHDARGVQVTVVSNHKEGNNNETESACDDLLWSRIAVWKSVGIKRNKGTT